LQTKDPGYLALKNVNNKH